MIPLRLLLSRGLLVAALIAIVTPGGWAQVPHDYPAGYRRLITAGQREGRLVIYSSTDFAAAAPLIADFELLYPGIEVEFAEMNSPEVYDRFLAEIAANGHSADVTWSSSMDLQIKLANDHYAEPYKSPEARFLPEWAVWRDEAFGTTFEPAVFVYNKRLIPPAEVPRTHSEFLRLIAAQPEKFRNNVTTYDIERSAVGFLLLAQDSMAMPAFWDFLKVLGAANVELEANTATMMERIASGKDLLGYNLVGSYALARALRDPSLGVVLPSDYTLVLSRVMLIAKKARHPNAARLWVDYILSRRGQTVIAERSRLFSIRADVDGEFTAATLSRTLGASARPIPVGPALLVHLDRAKRQEIMRRWRQLVVGAK
jgi:iron(III) transport system substrate-binding protein